MCNIAQLIYFLLTILCEAYLFAPKLSAGLIISPKYVYNRMSQFIIVVSLFIAIQGHPEPFISASAVTALLKHKLVRDIRKVMNSRGVQSMLSAYIPTEHEAHIKQSVSNLYF